VGQAITGLAALLHSTSKTVELSLTKGGHTRHAAVVLRSGFFRATRSLLTYPKFANKQLIAFIFPAGYPPAARRCDHPDSDQMAP